MSDPVNDLNLGNESNAGVVGRVVHLLKTKNGADNRALAPHIEYPYIRGIEGARLDRRIFTAYRPFERRAESLRSLRTQLGLNWFTSGRRALAIVCPEESGQGSDLAANLAVIFAQLGERTLLVDANMRSPRQRKLFGIEDEAGLTDVLSGRIGLADALRSVAPFSRLSLLCAGSAVPNPQELLAREAFGSLMSLAPRKFRAVIIDTPPAFGCADAQIVAARAGGCLIVARRHWTKIEDLRRIKQSMAVGGAHIVGVTICD